MKMWKRTMAFVLCAGFAFSGVACNENASSSTDEKLEGKTPQNFTEWFDGAKTAKVEISASYATKNNYLDKNNQVVSDPVSFTLDGAVLLAWTDDTVNAKFDVTIGGTMVVGVKATVEGCVVDGVAYLDQGAGAYKMIYDLGTTLNGIMSDAGVTEEQLTAFSDVIVETVKKEYKDIDAAFDEYFKDVEAEEGVKTVTEDSSAWANAMAAYLKTLNIETTTVETALNGFLRMINPTWTCEKILDEVATMGEMKVSEAYKTIDDAVKAETGKDVQAWKDVLLANEEIVGMLENYVAAERIAQIKELDIKTDIIDAAGDATVDEFLSSMVSGGEDAETEGATGSNESALVIEDLIAEAKAYISTTTLGNLDLDLEALASLNFNKLSTSVSVKYDENMQIEYIANSVAIDFTGKEYLTYYGETEKSVEANNYMKASLQIKISEVSKTAPTIALSENAVIVYDCAGCEKTGDATTIVYYEDVGQYLCASCYEALLNACSQCGNVGAYREEYGCHLCDDCYEDWLTETVETCAICGTTENIDYYEAYECYFCADCYAGGTVIACCICGEYDCLGHE